MDSSGTTGMCLTEGQHARLRSFVTIANSVGTGDFRRGNGHAVW